MDAPTTEQERYERIMRGIDLVRRIYHDKSGENDYRETRCRDGQLVLQPLDYLAGPEQPAEEDETSVRRVMKCAFFDPVRQVPSYEAIAYCQLGRVMFAYWFAVLVNTGTLEAEKANLPVAVKIMDGRQLNNMQNAARADAEREQRILQRLRRQGFRRRRATPLNSDVPVQLARSSYHFPQWSIMTDEISNQYMITDYATNGSVIQHFSKRYEEYCNIVRSLLFMRGINDDVLLRRAVLNLWRDEALHIFTGLVNAVVYMHEKNVCHLDLSPENIGIDAQNNPILLDFGNSEVTGLDDTVGRGRVIRSLLHYCAPEVRLHNRTVSESAGVDGKKADMYSLGVVLYWLLFVGCSSDVDGQWVIWDPIEFDHACTVCLVNGELSVTDRTLFQAMLSGFPAARSTATEVSDLVHQHQFQLREDLRARCNRVVNELIDHVFMDVT
ncbi:hypothetical protein Poli38472_008698 [Pythium oligandrum]|uniref:Protein kinase domain-containing protein n=1 Tax=Pythium oligandrum TaxID=41045 RepID=A0A8K1C419_PYTOL|nr:hypothetical protein Poli38472_008698 [Pythium oligandrum]|eukprot:TMW56050.1 hypothetical protein Poli38472_008698 [Pythium oligandrum]